MNPTPPPAGPLRRTNQTISPQPVSRQPAGRTVRVRPDLRGKIVLPVN